MPKLYIVSWIPAPSWKVQVNGLKKRLSKSITRKDSSLQSLRKLLATFDGVLFSEVTGLILSHTFSPNH